MGLISWFSLIRPTVLCERGRRQRKSRSGCNDNAVGVVIMVVGEDLDDFDFGAEVLSPWKYLVGFEKRTVWHWRVHNGIRDLDAGHLEGRLAMTNVMKSRRQPAQWHDTVLFELENARQHCQRRPGSTVQCNDQRMNQD